MTVRNAPLEAGERRLSAAAAEAWLPRTCFKHGPPERVGVELELLVHAAGAPERPTDGPEYDGWRAAALATPVSGRVTIEPGGQLELSGAPTDELETCLAQASADLAALRALAAEHGLELVGLGVDPREVSRRLRTEPRYTAMEAYLDRWGRAGRTMMRRTASVQVNLEAAAARGDGARPSPDAFRERWELLHTVGPVLVAAFANSPGGPGPWAGWASSRLGVWLTLDPGRTAEPPRASGEPVTEAWSRWCLDAPLMMAHRPGPDWSVPDGLTFRDWISGGAGVVPGRGAPTADDLAHHLTTLFPPVRARGHLEVRFLDAQPGGWWQVPVSVLWALTVDRVAGRAALAAASPHAGRWEVAARCGLREAGLAAAAVLVLEAAVDALRRRTGGSAAAAQVEAYLTRWTRSGRSPGDDVVDDVRGDVRGDVPGDGRGAVSRRPVTRGPAPLTTGAEVGHPC